MPTLTDSSSVVRFGAFELDLTAGELRKSGRKLHLQDQHARLLAELAARPGEVVTREELRQALWPADTFVDFDRSLNVGVSRLREALGDSATSPRFIETLPRRGYRFLSPTEPIETSRPALEGWLERRSPWRTRWTAAGGALTLAAIWLLAGRSPAPTPPVRKFAVSLPGTYAPGRFLSTPSISPDGRSVAYVSPDNRKVAVWDLARGTHRLLPGTDRAMHPRWSPDSKLLAFWSESGEIKRTPASGGPVARMAFAPGCCPIGSWSPDGRSIVYKAEQALMEVPAEGGEPKIVFEMASGLGVGGHFRPSFLPPEAGRAVVFSAPGEQGDRLLALDLDSGNTEVLTELPSARGQVYSPSGHLVYADRANVLWAVAFSPSRRRVVGDPFPIANGGANPSVSTDGTLLFEDATTGQVKVVWVDRQGRRAGDVFPDPAPTGYTSFSRDGRRLAVNRSGKIWVHEAGSPHAQALAFTQPAMGLPVWSPAGDEILYPARKGLYLGPADGSRDAAALFDGEGFEFPSDWSPDGRYIFFDVAGDIAFLERDEAGGFEVKIFLSTPFNEKAARLSPDGRWVAYVSEESGVIEVYTRRFPEGDGRLKVSLSGGRGAQWGADGKTLYYVEGQKVYEVSLRLGSEAEVLETRVVTELPAGAGSRNISAYPCFYVSPDGEKFAVLDGESEDNRPRLRVHQNWFEEFRDR